MDPLDDELHDDEVSSALGDHAARLTGPLDTDDAFAVVTRRAGISQRRWRLTVVVGAAAAAVAIGGLVATIGGDREVLRGPATRPTAETTGPPTSTTVAPAVAVTTTAAVTTPGTSLPLPIAPVTTSTLPAATVPTTIVAVPPPTAGPPATTVAPPVTTAPTVAPTTAAPTTTGSPAPTTETYTSAGGSIVVRLAGGRISLDDAPDATSGWSTRIDDDGPDRVRVRFELDDRRSEIRVDLEDGQLVPQVIES